MRLVKKWSSKNLKMLSLETKLKKIYPVQKHYRKQLEQQEEQNLFVPAADQQMFPNSYKDYMTKFILPGQQEMQQEEIFIRNHLMKQSGFVMLFPPLPLMIK